MGLRGEAVDARWRDEVMSALPDGEVIYSCGSVDYQGELSIIARLDDGRWLHYEYSYGSCSGCDRWEDNCDLEKDVKSECSIMDKETMHKYLLGCQQRNADWVVGGKYSHNKKTGSFDVALVMTE